MAKDAAAVNLLLNKEERLPCFPPDHDTIFT